MNKAKIFALLISFQSWAANEKIWIKESTWIFLNKLCNYHLSEDIKILCVHYQKRSQQYTREKNTFLKCEDVRVSWDLKIIIEVWSSIWKTLWYVEVLPWCFT